MRVRLIAMIAAPLVAASSLVACGESEPREPRRQIVVRSAEQNQLHQLDEMNRAIALKRAIYASGYTCRRVEESGFVGAYKNLDMWMARCNDRRSWAIFAGPDGSAQVRDCRDVEKVGLPACAVRKAAEPA